MILSIVQARMSSTRLPGKVMLDLMGKPVLEHIIARLQKSKHIGMIAVATTDSSADDQLAAFVRDRLKCPVFRGSEFDVLSRFYYCARQHPCSWVVRATADDPLTAPEIVDMAIERVLGTPSLDYCSNTLTPTFPEGVDTEVFSFATLERAYKEAALDSEREHVTPYIKKNPSLFKLASLKSAEDLSAWRWTLDKPNDLEFIKAIYRRFYSGESYFSYQQVVDFIKENPHLLAINAGTMRNEGYFLSLQREKQ